MAKILFRADGGTQMGLGHIMRSLALAEAFIDRGHDCHFVLGPGAEAAFRHLDAAGIVRHAVTEHADHDAAASLAIASDVGAAGIIVDGYHFSDVWRAALRAAGLPVLAFADGSERTGYADLLLDPSAAPNGIETCLFGPDYVLLRREILTAAHEPPLAIAARNHVLVIFGGSDPLALSLPVTMALRHRLGTSVPLDLVLGAAVANADAIAAAFAGDPNTRVHRDPPNLGRLMRGAGLAVSAAGGTLRELAALGVPAVIAIVAANQRAGAEAALAAGWCVAAEVDQDPVTNLIAAAARLWADAADRERRASLARQSADLEGADRVAGAFLRLIAAGDGSSPTRFT